ncbi:MAG: ComEC family competence protein [Prevotellaceae bacterium]|jgi:competence protein ComEC|nr:ComEC family competence protein [Prevotellaceae bacterium]
MLNFLHRTPFLRLLLPLVAGIVVFAVFPNVPKWLLLIFFLIFAACIVFTFFIKNSKSQFAFRWLFGAGISVLLFVAGYFLSLKKNAASEFHFSKEKSIYLVELTSAPLEKKNSFMLRAKVIGYQQDMEMQTENSNVILYLQKNDSVAALLYGDRLLLQTQLQPPQPALNPDAFDFGTYLRRQGVAATGYVSANYWQHAGRNTDFSIFRFADRSQKFLLNIYRELGLKGNELAIVAALTLGYIDEIDPELAASYSASGAVHILSVSGLHVGIIYGFLVFILSLFLKKQRWANLAKSLIIIVFLWIYACITGLSPSVMRAAFMCSIVAFSLSFNRKSEIFNSIFLSAFVLLLINPNNLFNIGFQLSYAAVLSIVIFAVPANNLLKTKNKALIFAVDILIISVAAQLGTAPFTIYYFHTFPTYFLLTNIIAIPLSTVIIYMAITTLALSAVPFLSVVLASVLESLLVALNGAIHLISHLPVSVLNVSVSFEQMWLIVLALVFCCVFYYSKKFFPIIIALCCVLLVFIVNLKIKYETLNSQKVVIYSAQRNTHISFIEGNENTVFTTDSVDIQRLVQNFWDNNKLEEPAYIGENGFFSDGFIEFRKKKFYILTNDFFHRKTVTNSPLEVDYLIIGALQKPRMEQLLTCFLPKNVVICNGVSAYYTADIVNVCIAHSIPIYKIAEKGALVLELE